MKLAEPTIDIQPRVISSGIPKVDLAARKNAEIPAGPAQFLKSPHDTAD
jgi:hypothetical protein